MITTISVDNPANGEMFDKKKNQVLILIESRPLVQWCLSRWLEEDFDVFRVVTLSSSTDTAPRMNNKQSVDLVVWSIGSLALSQSNAFGDLERIKLMFPNVPIVLLADREEVADIAEGIRHGARGYIPTSLDKKEIAEILRFVILGGTFVPASIIPDAPSTAVNDQPLPDPASPFVDLTPRELEVVDLLRQAKSNKVIAYELDLSESTVKVIVHRIMNKLNAANRTEVACLALRYFESRLPSAN
ncbi:MAG: LuxR C-terminal-related transcriptional regulator [Geminicoccaceae bacterium]